MLTGTATNAPKSFPKSPEDLFKKRAEPMNAKQFAAVFSQILGKPVTIDHSVAA